MNKINKSIIFIKMSEPYMCKQEKSCYLHDCGMCVDCGGFITEKDLNDYKKIVNNNHFLTDFNFERTFLTDNSTKYEILEIIHKGEIKHRNKKSTEEKIYDNTYIPRRLTF